MDKEMASFVELSAFLNHHNMKRGDLICEFEGEIKFELSRGTYTEQENVRIFIESGNVVFEKLNPYEYPMDNSPKWQDYKLQGDNLIISGEHKQNNMIGKYRITITPQK